MEKEKLLKACGKYGFVFLGVFGSYASGKNTPQSDLDLLVSFSGRKTLLDMVRIEREMSESLGIKIDLLTENSISPYLRDKIKNNMIVIYDNKR
jgi:predicted nucleotidyltransferase